MSKIIFNALATLPEPGVISKRTPVYVESGWDPPLNEFFLNIYDASLLPEGADYEQEAPLLFDSLCGVPSKFLPTIEAYKAKADLQLLDFTSTQNPLFIRAILEHFNIEPPKSDDYFEYLEEQSGNYLIRFYDFDWHVEVV